MGGLMSTKARKAQKSGRYSQDSRVLRVPYESGLFGHGYKYKTGDAVLHVTPHDGVVNKFRHRSAPRIRRENSEDSLRGILIYSTSDSGVEYGSYNSLHSHGSLHRIQSVGRPTAFQVFATEDTRDRQSPQNHQNRQNHPHRSQQHTEKTQKSGTHQHRAHQDRTHQHRKHHQHQHQKQQQVGNNQNSEDHQHHKHRSQKNQKHQKHQHHQSEKRTKPRVHYGDEHVVNEPVGHPTRKSGGVNSTANGNGSVHWGHERSVAVTEVQQSSHVDREADRASHGDTSPTRRVKNTVTTPYSPVVCPPTARKRDLITNPRTFDDIDAYTLQCSEADGSSVTSLASYLSRPAETDLHRVRAIYRWIACNIRFEVKAAQSRNPSHSMSSDPRAVLINRKASAHGFANLTAALCREMDILVRVVTGFSKDVFSDPDMIFSSFEDINHAWNLVFVYGDWHPMDCTWASGYIDDYNHFQVAFTEFYFLTDPTQFVWSHFPFQVDDLEASWKYQLLHRPVDLPTFNNRAKLNHTGLEWGVELLSHGDKCVQVDKFVMIQFRVHNVRLKNVVCKLNDAGTGALCSRYALSRQKAGGPYSVYVCPPSAGKYILYIYGDPFGENMLSLCPMVNYALHCISAFPDVQPYPEHNGIWGVKSEAVKYGFANEVFKEDHFLIETGFLEFHVGLHSSVVTMLKLKHAVLSIPGLNDYAMAEYSQGRMTVKVRLPRPGYYKLSLYAKPLHSEGNSVDLIAAYLVHTTLALPNCQPFPKTFPFTQTSKCRIIEPRSGWLPADEMVRFHIECPDLQRVLVDGTGKPAVTDGVFMGTIEPRQPGETVSIYGNLDGGLDHDELYRFVVVDNRLGVVV